MTAPPAIEAAFPLSPLQEGMLYHSIRAPGAGTFHVQCTATLDGALDHAAFARAWELAAVRHPALRTFFAWEGRERPLQVVRARASIGLEQLDWSEVGSEEQEARWEALLHGDRARGFDLARPPLMRVTLARVATTRHRLLWSMHHALVDGWSALVVLDEIMRDHAAIRRGAEPPSSPAPRFDRFVGWLEAQDRTRDERFWRDTLAGFTEPTPLPGGHAAPRDGVPRTHATLALDADLTRQLQSTAAALRVTLNTLLVGAWATVLSRHADTADVVFGVTTSERPPEIDGVERAVGLYLSTVPLRATASDDAVLPDWLRALQRALSDARAHAAPGLAAIQRWSAVAAPAPLFRSLVVFENFADDAMRPFVGSAATRDELSLSDATMSVPNDIPLVLMALPGERLLLDVVYDPRAVPAHVAGRLPAQLSTLLARFASDSERPLGELSIVDDAEQRRLVEELGGASVAASPSRDVLVRFEEIAAANPGAVAIATENDCVTYGALERHAQRLAQRIAAAGLRQGSVVGILAERAPAAIAAMLGALKAGVAYAPLDPATPAPRLTRMSAQMDAVLVTPALADRVPPTVRTLSLDAAAALPELDPPRVGNDALPAYVIFTSGSTGEPKGVVVERAQLAYSTAARDVYYAESPRAFLLLSSLAVDSSVAGIYWTLSTGGTLVLPAHRAEQDVDALARLVERAGVTHMLLVPSLHRAILDDTDTATETDRLASLCCVIVAGEACPSDVVRLHHRRLPGVALHNEYGPSEATVWATAGELHADDPFVTIGRPIPGTRVYLLDAQRRLAPLGAIGELCIGGPGVARGYLCVPETSAPRFIDDPLVADGRMYRTGDRARFLPDGSLEFLGRVDEQLKLRGFRVEPAEIERALAEHPAVREGGVALVGEPAPSDGDAHIEALVAALAALPLSEAERLLRSVESPS